MSSTPPDVCAAAQRLVAACRDNKTSLSVLFLLRLGGPTLAGSEIGAALLQLCQSLGVAPPLPDRFFHDVKRCLDAARGARPVAPELTAAAPRLDDAMELFRQRLAHRRAAAPAQPFLYLGALQPTILQLGKPEGAVGPKGFRGDIFVVCGSPEAALVEVVQLVRREGYMFRDAVREYTQVYEHQKDVPVLGPAATAAGNLLTSLIVDWEMYVGRTRGRRTRDDLEEQCQTFPAWFCGQLARRGLVQPDAELTVVYKSKSRPVPGPDQYKVSAHFIFSLTGTLAQLRHAVRVVLGDYLDTIKKPPSDLCDEALAAPWIGYDPKATLKNGFALPFSKKRRDDPAARLVHRAVYRGGRLLRAREFAPAGPHELGPPAGGLNDAQALRLLHAAAYTKPTYYLTPLSPAAAAAAAQAQQNRTAARHPAACGGGDPPPPRGPGGSHLPAWFASAFALPKGTLSEAFGKNFLKDHPDPRNPVVMQYGYAAVPCPVWLLQRGALHRHRSNTVVVASQDDDPRVYVRCSACCMEDGGGEEEPDRLRNKAGNKTEWLALTDKGLAALLARARAGACVRPSVPAAPPPPFI